MSVVILNISAELTRPQLMALVVAVRTGIPPGAAWEWHCAPMPPIPEPKGDIQREGERCPQTQTS